GAVKVLPPEGVKDLRKWRNAGLTREEFLAYVERHGVSQGSSRLLDNTEPLQIAERWLHEEHWAEEGFPVLRKYAGQWFRHDGRRYELRHEEADIRGRLYAWLTDRHVKITGKND